ncbi:GntR family transcriptional regulator [Paenibacillus mendelii]|uniref:GntR family transcriptional regulator n=1 Tax=Paenibacillus mendelii TaxID=206163 RepID=A0ABV6J634_9BACL|nr:GntR family transcriptional regulator [Paenibacillus mendelii]MCQ6559969.1 GntR family transcriptional regulator [Paenibacillus mendelii]
MRDKQLNRYVLTDELYALLKQQIMSHKIPAGDKINIDKLARDLGVSNIPIRESLFRLASEGLVTVVPFKGMFVAEMNLTDINEIFEIRLQLEELSIRKAAPHIPRARLEQILHRLSLVPEEGDGTDGGQAVLEMNRELHGTILDYAGNENLKQMVTSLIERIHRYLSLIHYKIVLDVEKAEHEQIIRALLVDDIEQAVEAMRTHVNNSVQRLRERL